MVVRASFGSRVAEEFGVHWKVVNYVCEVR